MAEETWWDRHVKHDEPDPRVELSALIAKLEEQLRKTMASAAASEEDRLLKVTECSVELGVTWDKEADGDIKFWVLDFSGKASRENAQTITVTLQPTRPIETIR